MTLKVLISLGVILAVNCLYFSAFAQHAPTPGFDNPVQVTDNTEVNNWPTWSPDGSKLAYESRESGNLDIWVKNVETGIKVNITEDHTGDDIQPCWSPNSSTIAFRSYREKEWGYYLISAEKGEPERVMDVGIGFGPPTWSPDGSMLASISQDSAAILTLENGSIQMLFLPGHNVKQRYRGNLSWSPNGNCFAYTDGISGEPIHPNRMYVMRIDNGFAYR